MMYSQATHDVQAEESWFVAFGPHDVRALSLEQLDDAYRLDVINDATLVRSPAMDDWVPLGVVAGVKDEPEPVAVSPGPFGQAPFLAAPYQGADAGALFSQPAYQQPAYQAATTSWLPNSTAPAAFDLAPIQYPSGKSSRWKAPLVLAAVCGSLFVAYRLGLPAQVASQIGMKDQYTALASRVISAPGIDTLEGTLALLDRLNKEFRLDELQSMAQRLAGVAAAVAPQSSPSPQNAPAAAPAAAAVAPAATPAAPQAEPAAAPLDIASLPRATAEAPEPPAAAPVLANTRAAARPAPVSAAPEKPVSYTLDTNAMRDALERSKNKPKRKKDRYSKAADYDPLGGGIP